MMPLRLRWHVRNMGDTAKMGLTDELEKRSQQAEEAQRRAATAVLKWTNGVERFPPRLHTMQFGLQFLDQGPLDIICPRSTLLFFQHFLSYILSSTILSRSPCSSMCTSGFQGSGFRIAPFWSIDRAQIWTALYSIHIHE
jgi:hypothetical protein